MLKWRSELCRQGLSLIRSARIRWVCLYVCVHVCVLLLLPFLCAMRIVHVHAEQVMHPPVLPAGCPS